MLLDKTTVYLNNKFFGGTVVLATDGPPKSSYVDVRVTVIPTEREPMNGAMVWDFTVGRDDHEDHDDLLAAIERWDYDTEGCSVVEDIIDQAEQNENKEEK